MKNVLTFALLGASTVAAQAGGLGPVYYEPTPEYTAPMVTAPAPDWSGKYFGASIGYADATFDNSAFGDDGDGVIGGKFVGYQHDFGSFVLGAEGDFNLANVEFDAPAGSSATLDQLHLLKARAGYDLGSALVYGVAGYAYTRIETETGTRSNNLHENGYAVGLGTDYKITDNVIVGAEALYHQFDDVQDVSGRDLNLTTVKARVAYQF